MNIENKIAIVTGGMGGIGFATVQHLLRKKAEYVAIFDVIPCDSQHVIKNLAELKNEFKKENFDYFICDVTITQNFTARYDQVLDAKGYVDILINNAAVLKDKFIDLTIDINFKAVVHGTMIAVERMGTHKGHRGGVVVNIGSNLGLVNLPFAPVYNATKHAVVSFVRSMKEHNQTLGVRIVCLCPGLSETNLVNPDTLTKGMFDFVQTSTVEDGLKFHMQKPDNVALGIVEIIEKGKAGDVWLAHNDQAPFAVREINEIENSCQIRGMQLS